MAAGLGRVEFGGPDLPPRCLRDLLQYHVDRAPPGSRIDWCTYYFRDRALAEALIRASDRGVRVRLVLEPRPRLEGANDVAIAMLESHGLGGGLHLRSPAGRGGEKGHLHAKIYAFSDPDIAWVGSFNPSGDDPDNAEVIAEIGDQDRGHNLLLGIERPRLNHALRRYIEQLIEPPKRGLNWRLSSFLANRDRDTRLYFYPRVATLVVEPSIVTLPKSGSVRACISHLKRSPLTRVLNWAARRGADIDLLVHDTERRVSPKAFDYLAQGGVRIRRVVDPNGLPMHTKFLLVTGRGRTTAWLGSYNFNHKSRLHNAEVLLRTTDAQVVHALAKRFEEIARMAGD